MPDNVAHKLMQAHCVAGSLRPGAELALRVDQTLTQDATGTTVMLELEAMGLDRVRTELSVQYVDHNVVQADHKNADDHEFLRSACARWGLWYSPPGNGVSHPLHQQWFGKPGKTLLGADSHTPAAGAIGMLAVGGGGIEVALAMAGEPLWLRAPEIWGIELVGSLPPWVSAKDVVLELLRRHGVAGGRGRIIEYFGPGLQCLSAMDRHVIANMGTELGATTSVFPADDEVRRFLAAHGREGDFVELVADPGATYDVHERVDLSTLVPLIAMPSSPANVRAVEDVAGEPIYQAYVGSSANPGFRDFAVAAEIVAGRHVPPSVSFDISPSTRQILADLARTGHLALLVEAGARIHQAGCNGCIGMGQAPATHAISLRTVPRNFPGRSGTREDRVCLVSPETAAVSALRGCITDPRTMGSEMPYPRPVAPASRVRVWDFMAPLPPVEAVRVQLRKGPDIASLPAMDPLPSTLRLEVLLAVGDDVSTDEILPGGVRVLPFRSNIPRISEFAFEQVDRTYASRAAHARDEGRLHAIVAGKNYGQGSSREHAVLAPRYLGLRAVLARSFARIHFQNLVSYGVLPLLVRPEDHARLGLGARLVIADVHQQLAPGQPVRIVDEATQTAFEVTHDMSARQIEVVRAGGIITEVAQRLGRDLGLAPAEVA